MTKVQTKKDFSLIFEVIRANPNGDPLNGNLPRQNIDGRGEVSDVAIKHKIRNRLTQEGHRVYMQSAETANDGFDNLKARIHGTAEIIPLLDKKGKLSDSQSDEVVAALNEAYIDIRAFGAVITLKDEVSRGIKGAVSIQAAESIDPVMITTQQITKSVSLDAEKGSKGSDVMGSKHRVEYGVYRLNGSVNAYLGEKNGLTEEDVEHIKQALLTLFENDEATARPIGSMNVISLYWWEQSSKLGNASSYKVFNNLEVVSTKGEGEAIKISDYEFRLKEVKGLPTPQVYEGF